MFSLLQMKLEFWMFRPQETKQPIEGQVSAQAHDEGRDLPSQRLGTQHAVGHGVEIPDQGPIDLEQRDYPRHALRLRRREQIPVITIEAQLGDEGSVCQERHDDDQTQRQS